MDIFDGAQNVASPTTPHHLTYKQALFVHELLADPEMDVAKAYENSYGPGHSSARESAHKLLKIPAVKEAIDNATQQRIVRTQITQDWVLNRLKAVSDRCFQAEPVLDSRGYPTGEYKFDAANTIKATELIGKHIGMFKDKVDHQHHMNGGLGRLLGSFDFANLQDDELEVVERAILVIEKLKSGTGDSEGTGDLETRNSEREIQEELQGILEGSSNRG